MKQAIAPVLTAISFLIFIFLISKHYGTPPQTVHIVSFHCELAVGADDCYTVLETADGMRYQKVGLWGAVGDKFKMKPGFFGF